MKKALILQGGWEGHDPQLVAKRFAGILEKEGFQVDISENLDCLLDEEKLETYDLFVPCWTGGDLPYEHVAKLSKVIGKGAGVAGCHGGMCDAFRVNTEWQFITGGQWVSHPGGDGVKYTVNICRTSSSPIVEGIEDFEVCSEQYYVHVDPVINVLATTRLPVVDWYHSTNGMTDNPVMWTKMWGYGRVFYSSLGHHDDVFDVPEAQETMRRGMLWAAEGKRYAIEHRLDYKKLASEKKMF